MRKASPGWSPFVAVGASDAARQMWTYMQTANVLAAACIVVFGDGGPVSASAFSFVAVCILLSRARAVQSNPLSLLLQMNVTIYLVAPMVFLAIEGSKFEFGRGLGAVPASGAEYAATAPWAVLYLTAFVAILYAGLIAGNRGDHRQAQSAKSIERLASWPVVLFAVLVVVLTIQSNASLLADRISGEDKHRESLLVFLFFDNAFFIIGPLIYFARLAYPERWPLQQVRNHFSILLVLLWTTTILAGSKGGILAVISLCFVVPLSFLQRVPGARMLVPTKRTAAFVAPVVIGVFMYTLAVRQLRGITDSATAAAMAARAFADSAVTTMGVAMQEILYRISTLLDRFILRYHSFATDGFDASYANDFMVYVGKNFLNLVLPGTPFMDAYSPSSNLFALTLLRDPLVSAESRIGLLTGLNTQPYSMFGITLLLVGAAAPLILFIIGFVLARWYAQSRSSLVRLTLLYTIPMVFHCYGLEVVAATSIHLFVSFVAFSAFATLLGSNRVSARVSAPRADTRLESMEASP